MRECALNAMQFIYRWMTECDEAGDHAHFACFSVSVSLSRRFCAGMLYIFVVFSGQLITHRSRWLCIRKTLIARPVKVSGKRRHRLFFSPSLSCHAAPSSPCVHVICWMRCAFMIYDYFREAFPVFWVAHNGRLWLWLYTEQCATTFHKKLMCSQNRFKLLHFAVLVRPIKLFFPPESNCVGLRVTLLSIDWIIYVPNGSARAQSLTEQSFTADKMMSTNEKWKNEKTKKKWWNLPVWMYVCFFMSDFWWNRLPQYWHGYGRVSLWISRCVDNVLDRLNVLPHCLH